MKVFINQKVLINSYKKQFLTYIQKKKLKKSTPLIRKKIFLKWIKRKKYSCFVFY